MCTFDPDMYQGSLLNRVAHGPSQFEASTLGYSYLGGHLSSVGAIAYAENVCTRYGHARIDGLSFVVRDGTVCGRERAA